jgi:hypothetical protein
VARGDGKARVHSGLVDWGLNRIHRCSEAPSFCPTSLHRNGRGRSPSTQNEQCDRNGAALASIPQKHARELDPTVDTGLALQSGLQRLRRLSQVESAQAVEMEHLPAEKCGRTGHRRVIPPAAAQEWAKISSFPQPERSSLARVGRNSKQACASAVRFSRASMASSRSRRPCKCSTSEAA